MRRWREGWPARSGWMGILFVGAAFLGHDAWMTAKAHLAAHLIARAFERTLEDGVTQRPWAWADMAPVAELHVPRLQVRRHVLSDASGTAMAFGLEHIPGTPLPNRSGHSALAGHRDSWAQFLEDVQRGDAVTVTTLDGVHRYRVATLDVVDRRDTWVLDPVSGTTGTPARLSLVTCYPFDAWGETGLRYVVTCVADGDGDADGDAAGDADADADAAARVDRPGSPLDSVATQDLEQARVIGQSQFACGVGDVPVVAPERREDDLAFGRMLAVPQSARPIRFPGFAGGRGWRRSASATRRWVRRMR